VTSGQVKAPRSSLFSDATLGVVGAIASTGIAGIASIVIARELGVTDRGRWAVIASLAVIVSTLGAFGLPTAAAFAGARLQATERIRTVQAAIAATSMLALLSAVGYLAIAAIIRPPAPTVAVVAGLTIPLATVWYTVTHQLTLTVASMRGYALAQIAASAVTLAVIATIAITTTLSVLIVVLVSAGGQATGAAVSLVSLKQHGALGEHRLLAGPRMAMRILGPYLNYALITFATLSLTQIVQRVDVLLVSGYRGPHAAGLYAVAVQVTDLILVIPAALGFVMFRRGARSAPDHFSDAILVLRWTGLFGIAASLVALAVAAHVIPLVFGSGYQGSVSAFRWLLPGTVAFSLQSVLSNYLAGRGRPRIVLVAWLCGAVTGVVADLLVIPAYGITGAAIVSSASYVLVTGIHFHALRSVRPATAVPA
jgi:O-antigen/teichoic acid export membrane protein